MKGLVDARVVDRTSTFRDGPLSEEIANKQRKRASASRCMSEPRRLCVLHTSRGENARDSNSSRASTRSSCESSPRDASSSTRKTSWSHRRASARRTSRSRWGARPETGSRGALRQRNDALAARTRRGGWTAHQLRKAEAPHHRRSRYCRSRSALRISSSSSSRDATRQRASRLRRRRARSRAPRLLAPSRTHRDDPRRE
jgi:hypothetical protein